MRLFLAVLLPEDLKEALGHLITELSGTGASVKWVDPGNVHLTLKFLGEVEQWREPVIYEVSRLAAKEVKPFRLKVENVGAFPSLKRPRVIWVGVGHSSHMATLHSRIEEGFQRIGFHLEKRAWTPHLTIGRVKGTWRLKSLESKLAQSHFAPYTFRVSGIHLVKSTLRPEGPIYTTLRNIPLETHE
ncbi:MAG: RNA 2',3'-cyclic phosphodiesterase [Candidatus Glassbacteria bacterium]